jgi:hypothetical protein
MKTLMAVAFIAAGGAAILSHAMVISATSLIPPTFFAVALIFALLHLIHTSDRRY